MRRWPIVLLAIIWLVGGAAPRAAAAQSLVPAAVQSSIQLGDEQTDAQKAADVAIELSRLEAAADYAGLYGRMHPDSRAVVPEAAVVGWYKAEYANKTTATLTVTGVTFIDWTWGVTGRIYPRTAAVAFTQPYWVNGVRQDEPGVVHLVEYRGVWGWFFGATADFVDQQIALYAPDFQPPTAVAANPDEAQQRAARFPDPLDANIDAFWAQQFAAAGVAYQPPGGVLGMAGPEQTGCGPADPAKEAAFYCVIDQTIYYSDSFKTLVEDNIGDFGWVVVIAHEWAHHIQHELGIDLGETPDQNANATPLSIEQQADCLAGAYTEGADQTGWLDPGDLNEAIFMTEISGDPPGTSWNSPGAHGAGDARKAAFLEGYDGGVAACGLDLSAYAH
ncbi:MAG TPA: neutral zinc metallopeptidase [Thermomicrobiales bacterium]|nr:neutral zinc metallopeptidase [Thermomicrobiales bacterium]